jgi:hypothetical protein
MLAGCKGLFLKILQKYFVFMHENANSAADGGIVLYNSRRFLEIICVFNVNQARREPFGPPPTLTFASNGCNDVK